MAAWQKDEDQLLIREWKNGHCGICRVIAAMLGRSRGSVIGRGRRLGMPFLKPRKKKQITPPRVRVRMTARFAPTLVEGQLPKQISQNEIWDWAENRTHLVNAGPDQCRWPVGELEFCGGKREPDSSYCATHSELAFHKVKAHR